MIPRSDRWFLDVGGTFIKCSDGRCIPMPSGGSREQIAAALRQAVARESADTGLGIGVAIPGPFDYGRGIFLMRHKFAAVYGESFRALAGLPADTDLRFRHDVIAALEGSLAILGTAGDSRATGETALVTIGTGLGFAHTQDGAVQIGPNGSPARSIYSLPWGDGILEDSVSARGIRNAFARLSGHSDLSTAQIAQLGYSGNENALQVFSELGETLGEALAPLLEELHISTLLLAGQVSRSYPLFQRPLCNALDGIDIHPAPDGAVFAGLATLFDNDNDK